MLLVGNPASLVGWQREGAEVASGGLTARGERGTYLCAHSYYFVARESEKEEHGRELEERIEDLTKELSGLINAAGTKGREELRDYAVSLLQGETEATVVEEPSPAPDSSPAASSNPLALSIPFFLIGAFLLLLFPPVGISLLLFALVMALWGGISALWGRRS